MDEVITDASGKHRLTMHYIPVDQGANFHSLIWAKNEDEGWADYVVITREAFQPMTKHNRWVSALHSFDPVAGRAIIKIAEGDVPIGTLPVHYIYSWREWDLRNNREVRLLNVCKDPFDKYEPPA